MYVANTRRVEQRARQFARNRTNINLDDVVFVGATPDKNTIATLPSTYRQGDLKYGVYGIVREAMTRGLTLQPLCEEHPDWGKTEMSMARRFFYQSTDSTNCVSKAENRGILPFTYKNEKIDALNMLFAFSFWSGCAALKVVQAVPGRYNEDVVKRAINKCGFKKKRTRRGEGQYVIQNHAYSICSSPLAREFSLLGLPYYTGHKARTENLQMPWYAQFMYGAYGNRFNRKSRSQAETFQRIFMYVLLSNKTNFSNRDNVVSVDLMGSCSEKVGKKLTKNASKMLEKAFPGVKIPSSNRSTLKLKRWKRLKNNYANMVYINVDNLAIIIDQLSQYGSRVLRTRETFWEVRRLASNALLGYL